MNQASSGTGPRDAVARLEVSVLEARFADAYGSASQVPGWLLNPAANQRLMARRGQFAVLVRLVTENGVSGVGEAYGLPAPKVPATVITEMLAAHVLGTDPLASTATWQRLTDMYVSLGVRSGFFSEALSGIDMALWDLRGRILGVPVFQLLGGPIRTSVPCYASPVPLDRRPEDSAAHALRYVSRGFRAVKVKIGRGVAVDVAHIRAVRDAVGEAVDILVDANCGYSLDEATALGRCLPEFGVRWLEEPVALQDSDALAELRRRTGLTIASGENLFTAAEMSDLVRRAAVDVLMPNLARCGGITGALQIAAVAGASGVDIAPHGVGSAVSIAATLQFMAALPNLRTYEFNQLPNPLRDDLLTHPLRLKDGRLPIPDGPGLGIELNQDMVDRFTVWQHGVTS
jgi:L-alanine-DL-glutamate epimerase-like enolase superfamily enzyme